MKLIKRIAKIIGPGFITGAADDDPSGIATYAQTGSMFGYSQLWTAFFSFPFMSVIQEICGRIGLVTGKGLAGIIRIHYPKWVLYFAVFTLFFANVINIGADIGAMASSAQLLLKLPLLYWIFLITFLTIFLEVFISYSVYAKFLKYLTFSLFFYIITVFVVKQDWIKILYSTLIPNITLSKDYMLNVVAILGTTISPYLFFWQADEEVEEEIEHHKIKSMGRGRPSFNKMDLRNLKLDTVMGMFFSNLVMFFIIVTTASTLGVSGIKNIETADQAALALKPIAGEFAFLIFAAGVIGTGLLAIPILAGSASYAISEAFGWKEGLGKKFSQAPIFYGVIVLATLLGVIINFLPIKPFQMLYYAAVINGICAPFLLVLIMRISNNKKIMFGNTNGKISNVLGWGITLIMMCVALFVLATLVL